MDYSFYGGKQGTSFNIEKNYTSISEMVQDFKLGPECRVTFGGYVIVANEKENISYLYRRGFDYSSSNGGAEKITSLTGAKGENGKSPILRFDDYDTIAKDSKDNETYTYSELAPDVLVGKYTDNGVDKFNDHFLINGFTGDVDDKYQMKVGIKTIAPSFDFTVSPTLINIKDRDDFIPSVEKTDDGTHPYYHKYNINMPSYQFEAIDNLQWNDKTGSLEIIYKTGSFDADGNPISAIQSVPIPIDTTSLEYNNVTGELSGKGLKLEYVPIYYNPGNNTYTKFTIKDLSRFGEDKDITVLYYDEKDSEYREAENHNYLDISNDGYVDTDDYSVFYYLVGNNSYAKISINDIETLDVDENTELYTYIGTKVTEVICKIYAEFFDDLTTTGNIDEGQVITIKRGGGSDEQYNIEIPPRTILNNDTRTITVGNDVLNLARLNTDDREISIGDTTVEFTKASLTNNGINKILTIGTSENKEVEWVHDDGSVIENTGSTYRIYNPNTQDVTDNELGFGSFGFLVEDIENTSTVSYYIPQTAYLFTYDEDIYTPELPLTYEGDMVLGAIEGTLFTNQTKKIDATNFTDTIYSEDNEKQWFKYIDNKNLGYKEVNGITYNLVNNMNISSITKDGREMSWIYLRQAIYAHTYALLLNIKYKDNILVDSPAVVVAKKSNVENPTVNNLLEWFNGADISTAMVGASVGSNLVPMILASDYATPIYSYKDFLSYERLEDTDNYGISIDLTDSGLTEINSFNIELQFGSGKIISLSNIKYNEQTPVLNTTDIIENGNGFIQKYINKIIGTNENVYTINNIVQDNIDTETNTMKISEDLVCNTNTNIAADNKRYDLIEVKTDTVDSGTLIFVFNEITETTGDEDDEE